MANNNVFSSAPRVPATDIKNEAGGKAYKRTSKQALAQFAVTGCFNNTFYVSAADQLATVKKLLTEVDSTFIAKVAVYAREKGTMKDMPAYLVAYLSTRDPVMFRKVFHRVINNGKMLRNFVQIIRSGQVGRKSLGSLPKKMVREFFDKKSDETLFRNSVGSNPALTDIIKLAHVKPNTPSKEALFKYLLGVDYNADALCTLVKEFEEWKKDPSKTAPDVDFRQLTGIPLSTDAWATIAENAPFQATRMNLNTFARHNVFKNNVRLARVIADRLKDPDEIKRSKVLPYQLMVAFTEIVNEVPYEVREALQDALDIAIDNVPAIEGKVYVFPDVSGSMHSAVTGYRKGATSAVNCIQVAALIAAAILRKNPSAEIIAFSDRLNHVRLNPRDSVMTNAQILSGLPSGGTDCSLPLRYLNEKASKGDACIYISDNESWIDTVNPRNTWYGRSGTASMDEWRKFKSRNKGAKLVCIDLTPNTSVQLKDSPDVLNVGGFSDAVFDVVAAFLGTDKDWTQVIDSTEV